MSIYRMIASVYGKQYRFASIISAFITMAIGVKWLVEVSKSNEHNNFEKNINLLNYAI